MEITIDDFSKIWASTSPLTPYAFSEDNYKQGWNFVGATPPSRQMWDFLQKQNDEKLKYLLDNFENYLPLSGGTMTGAIKGNPFTLTADDGNGNEVSLVGNPNGDFTWNGKNVLTDGVVGTHYDASWTATTSSAVDTVLTGTISNLPIGVYLVIGKLPNISTALFGTTWHFTGSYFALNFINGSYGSGNTFTNILIVVNATNTLWLGSGQSGSCNFTYLDRGGICAVRLA